MNMLIIGNGFDLAHGRPTTYADFLQFLSSVQYAQQFGYKDKRSTAIKLEKDCPQAKEYLLLSLEIRRVSFGKVVNSNYNIQEILNYLDMNIWFEYFKWIKRKNLIKGRNWIDFELEIREIIEFFDHDIGNIYDTVSAPKAGISSDTEKVRHFWLLFSQKVKSDSLSKYTWSDFVNITYHDLEHLVRCLEIYLDDCVVKMLLEKYSPDIKQLNIDFVLSFNYTEIPTDIYPSLKNAHYIHGHAHAQYPASENNMVLGVNEYWDDSEKDSRTNFNCYKKFVQRIIKETGIDYKRALNYMRSAENKRKTVLESKNADSQYTNHIYIFGHSLDVTDGDILREIIETDDTDTTIFYKDKQQQANQIANLSKVLGQDELLKRTFSISPTIIFKKQADMKEL